MILTVGVSYGAYRYAIRLINVLTTAGVRVTVRDVCATPPHVERPSVRSTKRRNNSGPQDM